MAFCFCSGSKQQAASTTVAPVACHTLHPQEEEAKERAAARFRRLSLLHRCAARWREAAAVAAAVRRLHPFGCVGNGRAQGVRLPRALGDARAFASAAGHGQPSVTGCSEVARPQAASGHTCSQQLAPKRGVPAALSPGIGGAKLGLISSAARRQEQLFSAGADRQPSLAAPCTAGVQAMAGGPAPGSAAKGGLAIPCNGPGAGAVSRGTLAAGGVPKCGASAGRAGAPARRAAAGAAGPPTGSGPRAAAAAGQRPTQAVPDAAAVTPQLDFKRQRPDNCRSAAADQVVVGQGGAQPPNRVAAPLRLEAGEAQLETIAEEGSASSLQQAVVVRADSKQQQQQQQQFSGEGQEQRAAQEQHQLPPNPQRFTEAPAASPAAKLQRPAPRQQLERRPQPQPQSQPRAQAATAPTPSKAAAPTDARAPRAAAIRDLAKCEKEEARAERQRQQQLRALRAQLVESQAVLARAHFELCLMLRGWAPWAALAEARRRRWAAAGEWRTRRLAKAALDSWKVALYHRQARIVSLPLNIALHVHGRLKESRGPLAALCRLEVSCSACASVGPRVFESASRRRWAAAGRTVRAYGLLRGIYQASLSARCFGALRAWAAAGAFRRRTLQARCLSILASEAAAAKERRRKAAALCRASIRWRALSAWHRLAVEQVGVGCSCRREGVPMRVRGADRPCIIPFEGEVGEVGGLASLIAWPLEQPFLAWRS